MDTLGLKTIYALMLQQDTVSPLPGQSKLEAIKKESFENVLTLLSLNAAIQ